MASLKVYYDAVIGFERLNFSIPDEEQLAVDALAV